jgi:hypothetical protein
MPATEQIGMPEAPALPSPEPINITPTEVQGESIAEQLTTQDPSPQFKVRQDVAAPQIDEYSPEQIESLKGTTINMPISIAGKAEPDIVSIDAYEAYMENADQQSSIENLLNCLVG